MELRSSGTPVQARPRGSPELVLAVVAAVGAAYQLGGWIPGGAGWRRCGMMLCGRRLASEVMRWRIL